MVADSRAKARAAVNQLEVAWEPGRLWQQPELEAIVTVGNGNGVTIQDEGDAEGKLREETTLTAEYRTPFAVHAHLEAQAALADVQPDKVRIWCSTQAQGLVRSGVAKALGVKEEIVEVFPTYVGGGFGRKTGADAAVEAARLAKAAGVPVHVGWTREEDMRYGYFRPLTHHMLAGRLDANGNLIALEHRQASGDVAFDFLPGFLSAVMGADFGAYRGARIRYAVPNKRTVAWRTPLPIRTGWWRGLGLLANTFAVESFMDELAASAGADPVEFRLRHLLDDDPSQQRMKAVIQAAAEKAGWGAPPPEGRARGMAATLDVDTAVAAVAEISAGPGQRQDPCASGHSSDGSWPDRQPRRGTGPGGREHHVGHRLGAHRGDDRAGRPGDAGQLRHLSALDHERGARGGGGPVGGWATVVPGAWASRPSARWPLPSPTRSLP